MPMQHIEFCEAVKIENSTGEVLISLFKTLIRGYMLESPRQGGSNEGPQSMFSPRITCYRELGGSARGPNC